jgi:hypothetical protein
LPAVNLHRHLAQFATILPGLKSRLRVRPGLSRIL